MNMIEKILENVSIFQVAEQFGYHPVRKGNSWQLKEHDSCYILINSSGKERFYWHSRGLSGGVIDFYSAVTNRSLKESIHDLYQQTPNFSSYKKEYIPPPPPPKKPFQLPNKNSNSQIVQKYLSRRGIHTSLISQLLKSKQIFQDIQGNVVFTGKNPETNRVAFACLRGTERNSKFRMDLSGSQKEIGFYLNLYTKSSNPKKLFICESPIDCLSVASLLLYNHCSLEKYAFISLGGTSVNALQYHLEKNPQINMVYLCQDNDAAGEKSRQKARETLEKMGFAGKVMDKLPQNKDFNEDLIALKQTLISPKQPIAQTQALAIG